MKTLVWPGDRELVAAHEHDLHRRANHNAQNTRGRIKTPGEPGTRRRSDRSKIPGAPSSIEKLESLAVSQAATQVAHEQAAIVVEGTRALQAAVPAGCRVDFHFSDA